MDIFQNSSVNQCEPINYCSDIDDYRPVQSTLLTRFTTTNCSELWRTSNQDYGAFYYRQIPTYCVPDNLKAKTHRRHNRFQDWLSYQTKCQNVSSLTKNSSNNNQTIFPSNRNETVRVTHRKTFVSKYDNQLNLNTLSPCGEDGLITEFIVKKILNKLQCLINPDEYHDVAECAQILVSEILTQEPTLCTNEIVDRVVTIMITPPNNTQSIPNPCYSNDTVPCSSPQPLHDNCQTIQQLNTINNSTTVTTSGPLINCPPNTCLSTEATNVFEKLTALENAISKISNPNCSSSC